MAGDENLLALQRLQFSDRQAAEQGLLVLLHSQGMRDLVSIQLNVKPESLNSLNGVATFEDARQLFFKCHTEENEQLTSYYNAQLLQQAGYPMVNPRRLRSAPGEQIVFYEMLRFPTLFDLLKEDEDRTLACAASEASALLDAHAVLQRSLLQIYLDTLHAREDYSAAPIQQLFAERLRESGRLGLFYRGKKLQLGDQEIDLDTFFALRWRINGVRYAESLGELVLRAQKTLPHPAPTIVGHGDAHNGNVFWDAELQKLLYFDPAFAGRHSALLDFIKPLFHNVFARWMYFPQQVQHEFDLSYRIGDGMIEVQHSYRPSALRTQWLQIQVKELVRPLIKELRQRELLDADWQSFIRSALLCCPLLTINLAASYQATGSLAQRYPANIKLLGFCMAVEMAGQGKSGQSEIGELLEMLLQS